MQHESNGYTNCNWYSSYSHRRIDERTRRFENNRTSGDNSTYSIAEIIQNTEKSPEDLKTLVVTQTAVKEDQLALI